MNQSHEVNEELCQFALKYLDLELLCLAAAVKIL